MKGPSPVLFRNGQVLSGPLYKAPQKDELREQITSAQVL